MHYNKNDHHWIIKDGSDQIYSSAQDSIVAEDNEAYLAWKAAGGTPTRIIADDLLKIRIEILEETVTDRRRREAGADDAGGSADGRAWMANLEAKIEALRTQLAG